MAPLNRKTNVTISVKRMEGKIALEECVGVPFFNCNGTTPATTLAGGAIYPDFLEDAAKRLQDLDLRLQSMDQTGIAYAILSLTSPGTEGIADAKMAIEMSRKSNDHLYEKHVKPHPDRFGFFACLPMQDPVAAAKELERAVTKLGAKGALINGFSNIDPNDMSKIQYLDEPVCAPFWAKLAELNVPLYLHPRTSMTDQQRLYTSYPAMIGAGYGFGVETAGHALRITCSGILDQYPHVQILLGHGAEALPFWIRRMDNRIGVCTPETRGPHKQEPSYYLQNNFYATLAGIQNWSTVKQTMEEMGLERTLFSVVSVLCILNLGLRTDY
jgi:gamma-resorcylate decarboxylase